MRRGAGIEQLRRVASLLIRPRNLARKEGESRVKSGWVTPQRFVAYIGQSDFEFQGLQQLLFGLILVSTEEN